MVCCNLGFLSSNGRVYVGAATLYQSTVTEAAYPKKNNKLAIRNGHLPISFKPFTERKQAKQQTPKNPPIKSKEKRGWKNNKIHAEKHVLFFNTHFFFCALEKSHELLV